MCAFFVLQCTIFGGKINTRRISQPDMESFFTKIIYEIFWSYETIMGSFKIIKIKCFYPPRILDKHWCIYSCLQIPPRENWFQYLRRVYVTAIKFPCIITLVWIVWMARFWIGHVLFSAGKHLWGWALYFKRNTFKIILFT